MERSRVVVILLCALCVPAALPSGSGWRSGLELPSGLGQELPSRSELPSGSRSGLELPLGLGQELPSGSELELPPSSELLSGSGLGLKLPPGSGSELPSSSELPLGSELPSGLELELPPRSELPSGLGSGLKLPSGLELELPLRLESPSGSGSELPSVSGLELPSGLELELPPRSELPSGSGLSLPSGSGSELPLGSGLRSELPSELGLELPPRSELPLESGSELPSGSGLRSELHSGSESEPPSGSEGSGSEPPSGLEPPSGSEPASRSGSEPPLGSEPSLGLSLEPPLGAGSLPLGLKAAVSVNATPCSVSCGPGTKEEQRCEVTPAGELRNCSLVRSRCLSDWLCGLRHLRAAQGKPFQLTCLSPRLARLEGRNFGYTWRFSPGLITTNDLLFHPIRNPSPWLRFSPALEAHSGTYRCDVQALSSFQILKRIYFGLRVIPGDLVDLDFQKSLTWEQQQLAANGEEAPGNGSGAAEPERRRGFWEMLWFYEVVLGLGSGVILGVLVGIGLCCLGRLCSRRAAARINAG